VARPYFSEIQPNWEKVELMKPLKFGLTLLCAALFALAIANEAQAQAGRDGTYKAVDYNGKSTWTAIIKIKGGKFDEGTISSTCDTNVCNNQVTSFECSTTRSSEDLPLTNTELDCDIRELKGNVFGAMTSNGAGKNAGAMDLKFLTGNELELFEKERRKPEHLVSMHVDGDLTKFSKLGTRVYVQRVAAKIAKEKAEKKRLAVEKMERDRLAAEKVERERLAAEKAERDRLAVEKMERDRLAAEKVERERLAAEKAERERLAAEQTRKKKLAAAQVRKKKKAAGQAKKKRLAAEKAKRKTEANRVAEIERKRKAEAKRLADAERKQNAEVKRLADIELKRKAAEVKKPKAARQTASAVGGGGKLEQQLGVLKRLRANGLIDDKEFKSKKDELLARFLGLNSTPPTKVARVVKPKNSELKKSLAKYSDVMFGNYHALVIGSNNYKYLPKLKTAKSDANAVAKTLKSKYGYKVKTLINATRIDILDAFDEYREILTKDDNLLIYYAGHGYLDESDNRGYWMPVDARPNRRGAWLSNADITGTLKALKANHVMVMADSCYSGTLTRGLSIKKRSSDYVREAVKKKTRVVITSGGLEPVADKSGGNHSPFASVFLNVLNSNNGVLDGTKLFNKMRRPVMLKADQTPAYADVRKAGHEGGDFLFVRRR
jgi:hypothetical protein